VLASGLPPEKITEELFLATLSRYPTPQEMQLVLKHLEKGADGPETTLKDLWLDVLFVLVNSKEFVMRR
jgi:hypothetical protein